MSPLEIEGSPKVPPQLKQYVALTVFRFSRTVTVNVSCRESSTTVVHAMQPATYC